MIVLRCATESLPRPVEELIIIVIFVIIVYIRLYLHLSTYPLLPPLPLYHLSPTLFIFLPSLCLSFKPSRPLCLSFSLSFSLFPPRLKLSFTPPFLYKLPYPLLPLLFPHSPGCLPLLTPLLPGIIIDRNRPVPSPPPLLLARRLLPALDMIRELSLSWRRVRVLSSTTLRL